MKQNASQTSRLNKAGIICLLVFTFHGFVATAQSTSNYTISNFTNGWMTKDMNGNSISTWQNFLITTNTNNQNSAVTPIGFDFVFMGKVYTHFIAGNDGQVALCLASTPAAALSVNAANDLTRSVNYPATGTDDAAILAPFWDNLSTAVAFPAVQSLLTGTGNNRCRVIEFNMRVNASSTSSNPDASFQVRIYETTGVIEFVYGKMNIGPNSGTVTASIGLSAGSGNGQFLALQDLSSFNFTSTAADEPATQSLVNSSINGNITALHSGGEGLRRIFRFTPPAVTGTAPAALITGGAGATCLSLSWPDQYSSESGYAVTASTDNVNFSHFASLPANSTFFTAYNLTNNTTYYFRVRAISEGTSGTAFGGSGITGCSLSGTYTVGPGARFATLANAADSVRIKGVTGSVILELQSGYTSASENFPIQIPKSAQLPCLNSAFQLTIRPAAAAVNLQVTGNNNTALLLADSVNYLLIDGSPGGNGFSKELTFLNTAAAPAIRLVNSSRNTFSNLRFEAGLSGAATLEGLINFRGTNNKGCDSNLVTACRFSSANPSAPKHIFIFSNTINGGINEYNRIANSSFVNFGKAAILAEPGADNWLVSGNSFYTTGLLSAEPVLNGVRMSDPDNNLPHRIVANYFGGNTEQAAGTPSEISYRDSVMLIQVTGKGEIAQNVVKRIRLVASAAAIAKPQIRLICGGGFPRGYNGVISSNKVGDDITADSIQVVNDLPGIEPDFIGISAIGAGGEGMLSNNVKNIHCYATASKINWHGIETISSNFTVSNNRVGSSVSAGKILNTTGGFTNGIHLMLPNLARIRSNEVQGIRSYAGILRGIFINNGEMDSVVSNKINGLEGAVTAGNLSQPVYGIACYPSTIATSQRAVILNEVHSLHNSGSGSGASVVGIQMGVQGVVSRNFVHSLSSSSPTYTSVYGIYIPDQLSDVDNNMVRLGVDSLGNSITNPNAFIGLYGGNIVKHNTLVITGSGATGALNGTYCFFSPNNALFPFTQNNIFMNVRTNAVPGDGGTRHICISTPSSFSYVNTTDYNLYYTTATYGAIASSTFGGPYLTLAAWQAAWEVDAHSFVADPLLVNTNGNVQLVNLHLTTGSPADGRGNNIFTSVFDYDGQTRSGLSPVDIGADAGNYAVVTGLDPVSAAELGIRFFPNPAGKTVFIAGLKRADNWHTLTVYTLSGKQMLRKTGIGNQENTSLGIASFPAGVYLLVLERKQGKPVYFKLVKQ